MDYKKNANTETAEYQAKDQAQAKTTEGPLAAATTVSGNYALNYALDEPRRVSLRERVEMATGRAYREARKSAQLKELAALLDKHPDVARILDLAELVRDY